MMREQVSFSIGELVPHGGAMSLLDRVVEVDNESLRAELEIRADSLFFDGAGVGAWVGIEYMAQAVAALGGWHARRQGETPKVGFLLGSRRFSTIVPTFGLGQRLLVEVRREFLADNGMGQYDCRIECDGMVLATATLTIFEPADVAGFLRGQTHE